MEIITATALLLASMNVFNQDANFAYHTAYADSVVTASTVYKKSENGKYLSHHLKYNYTYDAQQRLATKEVLKWNSYSEKWEKNHCLNYIYNEFGYTIEYRAWEDSKADYTTIVAKQSYDEQVNGAVAVASYTWDKREKSWIMQQNRLLMNMSGALLTHLELEL